LTHAHRQLLANAAIAASRDASYPCVGARGQAWAATIFATQLDGTGQNGLVRGRNSERVLGPKILTKWHAIELGGIAEAEFADRCVTTPPRGLSVVLIWG
jgi:hypothetical protein